MLFTCTTASKQKRSYEFSVWVQSFFFQKDIALSSEKWNQHTNKKSETTIDSNSREDGLQPPAYDLRGNTKGHACMVTRVQYGYAVTVELGQGTVHAGKSTSWKFSSLQRLLVRSRPVWADQRGETVAQLYTTRGRFTFSSSFWRDVFRKDTV